MASSLLAALEITKHGETEMRQDGAYAPIWMRAKPALEEQK
jgi:segregation and condensation protein A